MQRELVVVGRRSELDVVSALADAAELVGRLMFVIFLSVKQLRLGEGCAKACLDSAASSLYYATHSTMREEVWWTLR